MNILEINQIVKEYSGHRALDNVSLNIPEGSIYGLLGPNGAGKTSLIRIINQITAPDSGEVLLQGKKLKPSDTSRIGYLPEERGLYKKMKVGEQAVYLARLKGLSKSDAHTKLKYWLEKYNMMDWWDKKIEELSKGMQQKIQFIVTIVHEPKLLIFDEPFSGFDPINAKLLKEEILNLHKAGASIIFSTHNMDSVEEVCDHIALINRSKKILEGSINEIKKSYKTNLFELEYKGELDWKYILPENWQSLNHKTNKETKQTEILLNPGTSPNDLLKLILPKAEIVSFKEKIPRMNDIFISLVESNTNIN